MCYLNRFWLFFGLFFAFVTARFLLVFCSFFAIYSGRHSSFIPVSSFATFIYFTMHSQIAYPFHPFIFYSCFAYLTTRNIGLFFTLSFSFICAIHSIFFEFDRFSSVGHMGVSVHGFKSYVLPGNGL